MTVEREVLAFIREPGDEAAFDDLALRLFRWQRERNPVLASFWAGARPRHWREVPPLPVGAFKQAAVACGDPARAVAVFETSGTTRGPEVRGRHHFFTLDLYDAALLPVFERYLLPDGARLPMFILTPPPEEAPHSSLSYYFGVIRRELGGPGSRFFWDGGAGDLLYEALARALREAEAAGTPVVLLGTAFAFVHFCDRARQEGWRFRLPPGSRAMETGGFKGRSRELRQPELYALMAEVLGIPPARIVNQYGMTELSSQFYEPNLRDPRYAGFPRPKQGAAWCRVVIRDPETLAEVPGREVGLIEVVDLANVGSCAFLLTQDLGRKVPGGFEVLGRVPGAAPRGCSIAADIVLGGSGRHPGEGA